MIEFMDRWGTATPNRDIIEPLFLLIFRDAVEPVPLGVSVPWML